MASSQSIETILADVRRAHRLVHAYYRRVLDSIRVAVEQVEQSADLPLPYREWQPYRYSEPRPGDVTDPGRWAWDGLPYAHFEAWFTSTRQPTKGGVYLSIAHAVDTGFAKDGKVEPDSRNFVPVEETTSILGPVIIVPHGPVGVAKWSTFHGVMEEATKYSGWSDGKVRHVEVGEAQVAYGGFDIDLARLTTEMDLRQNLVEPLLAMLAEARRQPLVQQG